MVTEELAESEDVLVVDVELETGDDLLRDCLGGCRQKILVFGVAQAGDWGDGVVGAYCLECRARLVASGSLE